ncbi:1-acylglycerol-3-phosphate O-acyltransferase [Kallotenue papyrolyticum]|uniref:1-acylglycerol-3-phosphate O-acyltransferase n=1 Tax=Kallotenue papyrolyticum TaxID=1325125 RepID=UPI0004BC9D50|nr:1-acylglycerol-3-phosphate O-acyltransferase [Kallotenue papyrolyticum]
MTQSFYRWSPNRHLYQLSRRLLRRPVLWYFRATYSGVEHIPLQGAVLLACNHLSNLDPLLLGAICPRRINFLAKIELFRIPLFSQLIRAYGAIPLQRSASDPEALRLAEQVLEHGEVLALFPEGTRSRDGRLKPFRFGAVRLALKHDVPLLPVAISGTDQAMRPGQRWPRRVAVAVRFGAPLELHPFRYRLTGATPQAHLLAEATALLQAQVARLKHELDQARHAICNTREHDTVV